MSRLSLHTIAAVAVVTAAGLFAATSTQACDGPSPTYYAPTPVSYHAPVRAYHAPEPSYHAPAYSYKKVTVYEYEKVPQRKPVVAYDQWGDPVIAYKTVYTTVKVPVTKVVKVWH